jgi:hypothetical protein
VYGEQLTGGGAAPQLPAPSHVWAGVADPAVHDPAPHTVPAAAFDTPQALLVQVLVWQTIVGAGQSLGARQATQVPLPSQSLPPLSVHRAPAVASLTPQVLLVQVLVLQTVPWAGQSLVARQATQVPLPSQTVPPLSIHVVPAVALVVPQQPPVSHVSMTHAVVDAAQSAGLVQVMPPSQELEMSPVPLLELVAMPPLPVAVTPPAPPLPEIVEPSNVTVPSQPVVVAASAPVVRRNAVIRFDVSFICKPYRRAGGIAPRIGQCCSALRRRRWRRPRLVSGLYSNLVPGRRARKSCLTCAAFDAAGA